MIIHGRRNLYGGTPAAEGKPLHGAVIDSHKDHRLAMSFAIAALAADGETEIRDAQCVNISYPDFYRDLQSLSS
jgi:3-phosphoshikimate 1-carboxyvinyltransferase